MVTRPPVVAGLFYELLPDRLRQQIRQAFKSELGPKSSKERRVLGAIVPHAGYSYSGACAAHVYKALEANRPDTIVLIGPSHTGLGSNASVWLDSDWETPLGIIRIDRELASSISASSNVFDKEVMPHMREHCLEVQLPFIQYIWGKEGDKSMSSGHTTSQLSNIPKIVPIITNQEPSVRFCTTVGQSIAESVKTSGKKVVVLASSDFTHYGVSYGYIPFHGDNVREKIKSLDAGAIDAIKSLDVEKFIDYLNKTGATICGRAAVGVLLVAMKALGAKKGELLKYYLSGDLTGSYSNSVSYASIVFERR